MFRSTEGNRLSTCWATVLKCISEFERLHLIGSGARSDSSFFAETMRHTQPRDSSSELARTEQQAGNAQIVVGQVRARVFVYARLRCAM